MTDLLVLAAEEEGGGSFLVSPSLGLMFWTLLVFAISIYILGKVAFPRIAEALDKRQRAIEESIEASERTRRQADEIVARARKTGENQEAESLAEARRKREEMMEQARRDIQTETRRALQEIRREVADLTVSATEKVTRKALSQEDQKRLVDDALAELDFEALSASSGPAGGR